MKKEKNILVVGGILAEDCYYITKSEYEKRTGEKIEEKEK